MSNPAEHSNRRLVAVLGIGALVFLAFLGMLPNAVAWTDADCQKPSAVTVIKYNVSHKDGSFEEFSTPLQKAWDTGKLRQGDKITAFFKVHPDCRKTEVSFASYKTTADHFILDEADQQVLVDSDTGVFRGGRTTYMLMVHVPDCFFQIDLVTGPVIKHLSKDNLYGKRKIAWENGGKEKCNPDCPAVTPEALDNGHIKLSWDAIPGASHYNVRRAEGNGPLMLVDSIPGTMYLDTNTTVGVTYTYLVTSVDDGFESKGCARIQVTAVPTFPSAIAGLLATVGAVGTVVLMRRRK